MRSRSKRCDRSSRRSINSRCNHISVATSAILGETVFRSAISAMNRSSGSSPIKKSRKPGLHLPASLKRGHDHEYRQSTTATEWSVRVSPSRKDHRGDERILCQRHEDAGERSPAYGRVGREHRTQFMSGVKEWKGFAVTAHGVGDDVTFYESTVDFIATNGSRFIWNRLRWR